MWLWGSISIVEDKDNNVDDLSQLPEAMQTIALKFFDKGCL